jgi:hypothetical protein
MAKMKTFAVEVQVVKTVTVFVEARRENGAREKLLTEDGWREAVRHDYDDELPPYFDPKRMQITRVRTV